MAFWCRLASPMIAVALGLPLASIPAGATDVRTAAQEGSYPKFTALSADSKAHIGGLCIDIMRGIERVEPDLRFVGDQNWQPLMRIEAGVQGGQLDAACGLLKTPARLEKMDFIEAPLFPV